MDTNRLSTPWTRLPAEIKLLVLESASEQSVLGLHLDRNRQPYCIFRARFELRLHLMCPEWHAIAVQAERSILNTHTGFDCLHVDDAANLFSRSLLTDVGLSARTLDLVRTLELALSWPRDSLGLGLMIDQTIGARDNLWAHLRNLERVHILEKHQHPPMRFNLSDGKETAEIHQFFTQFAGPADKDRLAFEECLENLVKSECHMRRFAAVAAKHRKHHFYLKRAQIETWMDENLRRSINIIPTMFKELQNCTVDVTATRIVADRTYWDEPFFWRIDLQLYHRDLTKPQLEYEWKVTNIGYASDLVAQDSLASKFEADVREERQRQGIVDSFGQ